MHGCELEMEGRQCSASRILNSGEQSISSFKSLEGVQGDYFSAFIYCYPTPRFRFFRCAVWGMRGGTARRQRQGIGSHVEAERNRGFLRFGTLMRDTNTMSFGLKTGDWIYSSWKSDQSFDPESQLSKVL